MNSAFLYYILQLSEFLLIILLGISIISFFLFYMSNKFNLKFISFYGFFSSMDDFSLLMLSSSILREITLIYCILKISSFSSIYLYIFIIFAYIYAFFSFNIGTFIKETIISGIEYLIVYFLSLLSAFLVEVRHSEMIVYYIWILSIILIGCSIYFFVRNIASILYRDKNVRRNYIEGQI